MTDCTPRAASSTSASGSVTAERPATTASSSSPPKIGKPSRQLAWARASRCMKGDSRELPGSKPLAGTRPVTTRRVRSTSISTNNNSVQAMKPSKASREGDI